MQGGRHLIFWSPSSFWSSHHANLMRHTVPLCRLVRKFYDVMYWAPKIVYSAHCLHHEPATHVTGRETSSSTARSVTHSVSQLTEASSYCTDQEFLILKDCLLRHLQFWIWVKFKRLKWRLTVLYLTILTALVPEAEQISFRQSPAWPVWLGDWHHRHSRARPAKLPQASRGHFAPGKDHFTFGRPESEMKQFVNVLFKGGCPTIF